MSSMLVMHSLRCATMQDIRLPNIQVLRPSVAQVIHVLKQDHVHHVVHATQYLLLHYFELMGMELGSITHSGEHRHHVLGWANYSPTISGRHHFRDKPNRPLECLTCSWTSDDKFGVQRVCKVWSCNRFRQHHEHLSLFSNGEAAVVVL